MTNSDYNIKLKVVLIVEAIESEGKSFKYVIIESTKLVKS